MEKKNAFPVYLDMWKKSFDYRGKATLREFWIPVLIHLILMGAAALYFALAQNNGWSGSPFWVLVGFLVLAQIPFVALTVRRLHDTGRKGVWAWLLLFVGPGTLAVLILCASASGFTPGYNRPVNLYGPPEWFESSQNMNEDVYGPPEWFEPSTNMTPTVYGPPDPFEPSENEPVAVYGPPEWFDPASNENEDVYGPPEWFDPSENVEPPVYGPPEWLEPSSNMTPTVYGPPSLPDESGTEEGKEETTEEPTTEEPTLDPRENTNDPLYGVPTPTYSR